MKTRSLRVFLAASFIIFCFGMSMFSLNIPMPPSYDRATDQQVLNNPDNIQSVGPAGNPGDGNDYKSNAGTNLILQTIIDSVLGMVMTSGQNVNQSTQIPLSFGPIDFEFEVKISWVDNPGASAKDIMVEFDPSNANPFTFSGSFEILGNLLGTPGCQLPGLSLKPVFSPTSAGALKFRYNELTKTVTNVLIINDWNLQYNILVTGALSKALVAAIAPPAASLYESIDKLLPSGSKLSDLAVTGGSLSAELRTSSADTTTTFSLGGNLSTNASLAGSQILRASIAPAISLIWGKDQGGSYYQPTGKIGADINLDFYALTYSKTWDIINWQNDKTYDIVRIKAPVLQLSSRAPVKGESLAVSTVLAGELDGPYAGQIVNFQYYDGTWITFASAATQANGQANSSWIVTPNVGVYPIRVYYFGNSRYQSCYSEEGSLFVVGEQTKFVSPMFNNNVTHYHVGEVFTSSVYLKTVTDTPITSETVRFYYSGDRNETWTELGNTLTDGNGLAQLNSSFSPASGLYYFVAMYGGSTQYDVCSETNYHEITVINNRTLVISPDPLQGLTVERGVNKTYVLHFENFDFSPHLINITYNASGLTWFNPYATSFNLLAQKGYTCWVNVCVPVAASIKVYTGNFTIYRDNIFYRNFSYQFEVSDYQNSTNFNHASQTLTGSSANSKPYNDLTWQRTLYSTNLKEILVNVTFTANTTTDLLGKTITGNFVVGSTGYAMSLQHGSGTIAQGPNEFWFYLKEGDANMICRNYLLGNTTGVSLPVSGGFDTISGVTIAISYRTESLVKITSLFDGGLVNLTVNRGDDIKINWRAQGDSFEVLGASLMIQHPAEFTYKSGTFGVDPATPQSLGNLSYGKVNNSYTIFTCNVAGTYYIPYALVTFNAIPDDIRTAYDHTSYSGGLFVKVVGSFTDQVSVVPATTVTEDQQIELKYYAQDDYSSLGVNGLLVFINITKPDATNVTFTMNPIAGSPGWYHLLYKPDQDGNYNYFILAQNDACSLKTRAGSFSATGKLEMGANVDAPNQRALELTIGDNISAEIFVWHDGVLETPSGTLTATLKYPLGTTQVVTVSNIGTGRYRVVMNLSSYYDLYGWVPEQGWYEVNFTHSGAGWVTQSNSTFFYVGNPQIFIERIQPQVIFHQQDFLLNYTVRPTMLVSSVQIFLDNVSKGNLPSPTIFYNLTEGWHTVFLSCSDSFGFTANQSVSFYVVAQPEPETLTIFEDDFEHGLSGWNATGLWHLTSNLSYADPFLSPVHSAWCGREDTGTYNTGSRVFDNLTSPVIDLKRVTNAILWFSIRYNVETGTGFDTATVLVSTDGINFVPVYTRSSPNQLPSWTEVSVNLISYIGHDIWIRFSFDTINAAANSYQGWLIDDVRVTAKSWQAASLSSVKIGALTTYGSANPLTQYPSAVSLLTSRLATTATITQSLNMSVLQQYSIIWIDENGTSLPRADLEALMTWVYQGGSLVSSGDNFGTMNTILNYLNISTIASAAAGGVYSNITLHDVTEGLGAIYFQSPECSLNLSLYPYPNQMFPTVVQDGYVQGAAGWYGNGKIVITCDEDPFLDPASQDNTNYINKIFGWLSNSTPAEDILPPSACLVSVNPDPGMEGTFHINATLYDKSGISSAVARVRSLSNNVSTVMLYDDGSHGDGIAGDNQYGGNYITNFDDVGLHYLDLEVVDASPYANVQNLTSLTTFVVQPGTIPRIHQISQNTTFDYIYGGTEFHLSDNGYLQLTLPFAFPFYNTTFNTIYVSNNGWMSFITSDPSDSASVAFPSTNSRYAYAIAPYWNDLAATTISGSILVANLTLPGNHHAWVVTWQDVSHAGAGFCGSFQAILYESGEVKVQFLVMNDVLANGGYTCGLNLGSYSYSSSYSGLFDGINKTAILFTPTKESTPPVSISGLVATPSSWTNSSVFNVSWTNPWDYSYIGGVYYKLDAAPTSNIDGSFVAGYNITKIIGINAGSTGTHPVYIWVVDQANNTDYTTRISVNLYYDGMLPNNPTGCNQLTGSTVNATWQNSTSDPDFTWSGASDGDSGVAGYFYYWGADPAGTDITYTTTAAYNPPAVGGSGIYYLRVQTLDVAGNLAGWETLYEFRYDITPPTNPSPAGCTQINGTTTSGLWQNATSDPNFTWSGASDADSGVSGYFYYWGTDPAGTSASYTTSASYDPVDVGVSDIYYLRVCTNDSAGNLAVAWITLYEFRYDGDAPTNPTTPCQQTVGSTTSGTWQNSVNDPNFTWSGASDADSGVAGYYYYWGDQSDGTSASYSTVAGFDATPVLSGIYYLRVQTNDSAGNLASWVTLYVFQYDITPPTNPTGCIQTNGSTTSGVWQNTTNDANFTWSGATDTLSGVAGFYWYWGTSSGGISGSYTTSTNFDAPPVSSGVYYLRVQTNDSAGNLAGWTTLYTFQYDGDAPTNPTICNQLTGSTTSGVWQNGTADPYFTWSGATDAHSGVAGYFYYWGPDPAGTSSSYTTSALYDPPAVGGSGINYLRVQTNDSVGNLASWVTLYEFRYDIDAPTNPTVCNQLVGSTTSGMWQNSVSDPNFSWSGATDAPSGVDGYYCYWGTNAGGTDVFYSSSPDYNPGSVSSSGIYYMRVQTKDLAGNLAGWTTLYEFWFDINAPTNPTGCTQTNGSTTSGAWENGTNDANFTWSGASDAQSGVAGYFYYWGTSAAGTSSFYTTIAAFDPGAVTSGRYYLRVQTNDSLGNLAGWTTIYEFCYDGTPPTNPNPAGCMQTIGSTTSGLWQNSIHDPRFIWGAGTDADSGVAGYFIYWGTNPAGTSTNYQTGTTFDPADVGSCGIYYLRVQTNDTVGNLATWLTLYDFQYDNLPPTSPTECNQTQNPTTSGTWQNVENHPIFTWSGATDADSGIAGYYYYWGPDSGGNSGSSLSSATFNPGVISSGIYYLRVQTFDAAGNTEVGWVTLYEYRYDGTPPTNPTACVQTNGTTTSGQWQSAVNDADFTWSGATDAQTGVAGYLYYWGTDPSGTSTSYTTSPSFDPAPVTYGTYYLRVRANDSVGNLASQWVTLYVFKYDQSYVPAPAGTPTDFTPYIIIALVIGAVVVVIALVARRPKKLPSQGRKLEQIAAKRLKDQQKKGPPERNVGQSLFEATRVPLPGQVPVQAPVEIPKVEENAPPAVEEESTPMTEEGQFVAAFAASCQFCGEAIQDGKCSFCGAWVCRHCGTTNTPAIDKCAKCEKGRWG